jgi:hypothetical protein
MYQWLLYIPICSQFKILHSAHTVYLCVLFGPQKKGQVFPYTAIIVWYLQRVPRDYRAVHRNFYISQCSIICKATVPWLRQMDFDIRLRKPTFDWSSVHQGIVVGKLAMKLGFHLVLRLGLRHYTSSIRVVWLLVY